MACCNPTTCKKLSSGFGLAFTTSFVAGFAFASASALSPINTNGNCEVSKSLSCRCGAKSAEEVSGEVWLAAWLTGLVAEALSVANLFFNRVANCPSAVIGGAVTSSSKSTSGSRTDCGITGVSGNVVSRFNPACQRILKINDTVIKSNTAKNSIAPIALNQPLNAEPINCPITPDNSQLFANNITKPDTPSIKNR